MLYFILAEKAIDRGIVMAAPFVSQLIMSKKSSHKDISKVSHDKFNNQHYVSNSAQPPA